MILDHPYQNGKKGYYVGNIAVMGSRPVLESLIGKYMNNHYSLCLVSNEFS